MHKLNLRRWCPHIGFTTIIIFYYYYYTAIYATLGGCLLLSRLWHGDWLGHRNGTEWKRSGASETYAQQGTAVE